MEKLSKIDIFELSEFRSDLLCDLIAACPSDQRVDGCETVEGRIVTVFQRSRGQNSLITRDKGAPPRGEFDLWDAGATIVIRDRLRPNAQTFDTKFLGRQCVLIPVRTLQRDLEAAMEMALASSFKTVKNYAFVVLETGNVPVSFFESLATVGPIVPVRLTCRAQEIDWEPIEQSRVFFGKTIVIRSELKTITTEAFLEGKAVWQWLTNRFKMPEPRPLLVRNKRRNE